MSAIQSKLSSTSLQGPIEFNCDLLQALQAMAMDDSALGVASKAILEGKSSISTTPTYAISEVGSEIAPSSEIIRIVVSAPIPWSYLVVRLFIDTTNVNVKQVNILQGIIRSFTDQISQRVWEALTDDEKKLIIGMAGLGTLQLDHNQVDLQVKESLCQALDLGQCYRANSAFASTDYSQNASTMEPSDHQETILNKLDRIIKAVESQSDSYAAKKEGTQVEETLSNKIGGPSNISVGSASPSQRVSQQASSQPPYPPVYTWETWPHDNDELKKFPRLLENSWVETSYESANPYLPQTRRVFNWDGVEITRRPERHVGSQWPKFPRNLN